jgi:hypothetical protein
MNALRLLVIVYALASSAFAAEPPRQLTWGDLIVKPPSTENPLANLSLAQLQAVAEVTNLRDRKARGIELTASDIAAERAAAKKLKDWGIDFEAIQAKREEIYRKSSDRAAAVNSTLDGKLVRIAGYLLPLEFSGKQVTEFLLVPWAGACIHTPPPAPNQIVHVKADKPVDVKGMYDPVWVVGTIAANGSRKSVFMLDGSADIDVGYSISVAQVAPYSSK